MKRASVMLCRGRIVNWSAAAVTFPVMITLVEFDMYLITTRNINLPRNEVLRSAKPHFVVD